MTEILNYKNQLGERATVIVSSRDDGLRISVEVPNDIQGYDLVADVQELVDDVLTRRYEYRGI